MRVESVTEASDGSLRSLDMQDEAVREALADFGGAEVKVLYEGDASLPTPRPRANERGRVRAAVRPGRSLGRRLVANNYGPASRQSCWSNSASAIAEPRDLSICAAAVTSWFPARSGRVVWVSRQIGISASTS